VRRRRLARDGSMMRGRRKGSPQWTTPSSAKEEERTLSRDDNLR
jgi:hypothetical protein